MKNASDLMLAEALEAEDGLYWEEENHLCQNANDPRQTKSH